MKPTSKYFTRGKPIKVLFFIAFLVMSMQSMGQAIVTDSIPKSRMIAPTLIRVGTDFLGLAHTVLDENRDSWEFQAEIDVYRYFLSAEFGSERYTYSQPGYDYNSTGNYWRIGADINMIPREAYGGVLYFGLRYAKSTYDETLFGVYSDPNWGFLAMNASNLKVNANWVEVVAGMKGKIWKSLYLGYALRLKASLKIEDLGSLDVEPFRVPGYGAAGENTAFGLNYYIAWQFAFRQKYTVPKKP